MGWKNQKRGKKRRRGGAGTVDRGMVRGNFVWLNGGV